MMAVKRLMFAAALLLVTSPAMASTKVGVVDVLEVMQAIPEWTKTVSKLKKEWEAKQSRLQAEQDRLRKEKDRLDAKRVVGDPQAIAKEEAKLIGAAQQLADTYVKEQKLIAATEASLKEQMLRRVEAVVYKLAQDRDLAFVFEVGADSDPNVLYASASVNLTSAAVAGYKKAFKNKPFEVRKAPPSLPSAAGGRK